MSEHGDESELVITGDWADSPPPPNEPQQSMFVDDDLGENPRPISDDPEAPFGTNPDGSPRAPYGWTTTGKPRKRRPNKSGSRKSGPKGKRKSKPDYREGIYGLFQNVTIPLTMAGMQNPVFAYDAIAIDMHVPNIAEALQQLAEQHSAVAAMLDRAMQVGPYGVLVGSLIPMVAQIAVNHGLVPFEQMQPLGVMTTDDLSLYAQSRNASNGYG